MILYVICQLVCVIDSWAHTSFVHSILSLKLGVTRGDGESQAGENHGPEARLAQFFSKFDFPNTFSNGF